MAELIKAKSRTEAGTTACNRVRRAGLIPAVLNGDDCGSLKLKLDAHDFELLVNHHTGVNIIIDIAVDDGEPVLSMLENLQYHPVSGKIMHADFREISKKKKLHAHIEIELTGEPVGVTQDQGILDQSLHEIEVECLYTALVEKIEIDVSDLQIGDKITVADVAVPDGVTVLSDTDLTIVSVIHPTVETAADTEGETAEGEEATSEPAEAGK